ncbi:hypothetical protein AB0F81_06745 [Actinoplanes sp. NPDC024001]|uniref:hypothetical protein n=1 Tax=Actinoplanes sp. NPDC024001 TaxID=3154598 RepID=UPI0033EA8FE5
MGEKNQPNHKLINARMRTRSPTGPGHPMTRQELAEAVNAWQWRAYQREDRLDETDIGKLERGETHWPGATRREGFRAVLDAATDADLGFYRYRQSRSRLAATGAHQEDTSGVDLVEFASMVEPHGIGNAELTAVELACERLDQDFASLPPDDALARTRLLMGRLSARLRQPQTLRHHERLVRLAARLAGLRAWASFDVDDHAEADRWYEQAVTAAGEARAWSLGAWLLGAQSLIPWHRRDLGRAIDLIERGIYFASHGSDATTRAWLYALHARGCAATGDRDRFDTAYALAQEAAEYSSERDRRHGTDFADGMLDLRYYSGTGRLLLRHPERARPDLTGCLGALPESHTKARAVLMLFLADAAAQADAVPEATDLTHRALASTIHQPIMPILQQARRVRRLIHQRDAVAANGLDDAVQQFSVALTAVASRTKT